MVRSALRIAALLSLASLVGAGCSGSGSHEPLDGGDHSPPPPAPLDPRTIPKFVTQLVVPPAMPQAAVRPALLPQATAYYEIEAVQFGQQVLPPVDPPTGFTYSTGTAGAPATTVWGYGPVGDAAKRYAPGYTVEVRKDERVRVKWVNGLVDGAGGYLPHLLPVDDTLHWANPSGAMDMTGMPYTGPVPIVTHVHGAHVWDHSDGNPDDWFLPDANDLPAGYAARGPFAPVTVRPDDPGPGYAVYEYANDQPAATIWYHDHALGITRLNVMAGLAGFWLVRDAVEDGLSLPSGALELPLAIQDRSFAVDGSLRYPRGRAEFDGFEGPFMPEPGAMAPPVWNPEFFGDSIIVNGKTWPWHPVTAELHRLRLLNGCNSRFLKLRLSAGGAGWLPFRQVGGDQGLLPPPGVPGLEEIVLAPGERADVLVDFSGLSAGTKVTMVNLGPDEPYKGPATWLPPSDPETTGLVMRFVVGQPPATPPTPPVLSALPLAPLPDFSTITPVLRELTLNEIMDMVADVPVAAELGTPSAGPLKWVAEATERPGVGTTEVWSVVNLTADAHPIHLHLVAFQVLDRRTIDAESYAAAQEARVALPDVFPAPKVDDYLLAGPFDPLTALDRDGVAGNELAWKDTVVANPGEVTRLVATFDLAGKYVWHCHILEHEDNEMMRPLIVE